MLIPIRQTVTLSGGAVVLRAWGAHIADANLLDLLTFTATLAQAREEWHEYRRQDFDPAARAAFWRLAHASLERDCTLPDRLTWNDQLDLIMAIWQLNDIEAAEGKLKALGNRATRLLRRATQGQMMTA